MNTTRNSEELKLIERARSNQGNTVCAAIIRNQVSVFVYYWTITPDSASGTNNRQYFRVGHIYSFLPPLDHVTCESIHTSGTWNQGAWKRNAQQEYLDAHIEGAVRFDIATVCDKDSPLPLTLPTPTQFTEHVQKVSTTYL